MPPKRTRRASPVTTGLSAGERLKRAKLAGNTQYSAWGWVGTEVTDASAIPLEYRLATCGFYSQTIHSLCVNKYTVRSKSTPLKVETKQPNAKGELEDDVIVISDDDVPSCSSKLCKSNPYCLNYLGQEKWEDEDKARAAFMKAANLGEDPIANSRDPGFPVGLRNLGATCYANAYLQVWFQDLPFRDGVYGCQPAQDAEHKFEESPIFQLQVTFAAMQEGIQSAFNPVKLVESLKLRTAEQQDAQEFSKLFMAHLDTEFHKQSSPALKTLIADQFQGKQVYGTICENCHNRSERESDFLEIEVNIQNNATLEDRIAALLLPETLSGDNKYLCPRCESLQNAKRYTELRQLPPVLHFSLLRFVYDVSTMERKKSKHTISFPTFIDMDQFLGSPEMRKNAKKTPHKGMNRYALRGVLLHKGPSAYHGHYEAQVFDVQNQAWYQFNDEIVTEIESLGAKVNKAKDTPITEAEKKKTAAQSQRQQRPRVPQKKRRRVESDSDIEIIEDPPPPANDVMAEPETASYISSKDAYMLVYSRIDVHSAEPTKVVANGKSSQHSHASRTNGAYRQAPIPSPPARAMEAVRSLNAAHDEACEDYAEKVKQAKTRFDEIRHKVMDIYRTWQLSSRDQECVLASRQALEAWISRHLAKLSQQATSPSASAETSSRPFPKSKASNDNVEDGKRIISISEIVCSHGRLDPDKASDMKLITKAARRRIADDDDCLLAPELSPTDVCETCVRDMFTERLYQIEHPRFVARFDEIAPVAEDEEGYWISKQWLKDWRLAKPKMHVPSRPDPPPDAPEFKSHVKCEHDGLSTNITARRRISIEAHLCMQDLFPTWEPVSTETEVCPVCEALIHISKEDKRELRRQAEEEKAKLKHMHDNALNGNTALLENVPCALVPAQFVRAWRQWLLRPVEVQRPESLDNSPFLCEHGLLSLDPNSGADLDSSVAIIKRSDWDILEEIYSGGPLIAVENISNKLEHEIPVCEDCRRKKKSSFDMTEITVRILGTQDPNPTVETYKPDDVQTRRPLHPSTLMTYGSRKTGGLRQSNRLRQVKDHGKRRRVTITKNMSLKDLKIMFQEEFNIPILSQRLFYHGQELEDSSATVLSLGILSNDLLDLREESENINLLSDSDREDVPRKRRRHEGQGFGGTLLGGIPDSESDEIPEPSSQSERPTPTPTFKACPACTYENDVDRVLCEMCDTPLDS